ncbi:MAG: ATP-binding protein [Ignavibacteriae bacterium]|nr:ATP-binding protein [Ignavibacteriota bacterium]MCB9242434.1 ATP-binding protein [Ignavibacteriales bacterium]
MEYVDNSFDAFTDKDDDSSGTIKTKYDTSLIINVNIIEKPLSDRRIEITDNCHGISDISEIIKNIGNSDKKMQTWTNGQFGFGIYSFMAACSKLQIISKTKDKKVKSVEIFKDDFSKDKISDIKLDVKDYDKNFPYDTGTKIILSDFSQNDWQEIDIHHIVSEIKDHFELLLKEIPNDVKVIKGSRSFKCKPFDYNAYKGEEFKKEFKIVDEATNSEYPSPIRIYLKFTNGKSIERSPVFISRKRRVQKVSELKIFDTEKKSRIWKHPLITGYVDTGGILKPTISRTEYKKDLNAKRLFTMLRRVEDEIIDWVNENTSKNTLNNFSHIEDFFNERVLQIESDTIKKTEIPIHQYDEVKLSQDKNDPKRECILLFTEQDDNLLSNEYPTVISLIDDDTEDKQSVKSIDKYSDFVSKEINVKRKYGLRNTITLKIDGESNPVINASGIALRSHLIEKTVVIFKKHPDFERRIKHSPNGNTYVTKELIHYLALEYLSNVFTHSDGEGEDRIIKINLLKDSFYKLQQELNGLKGQKLTSIY